MRSVGAGARTAVRGDADVRGAAAVGVRARVGGAAGAGAGAHVGAGGRVAPPRLHLACPALPRAALTAVAALLQIGAHSTGCPAADRRHEWPWR